MAVIRFESAILPSSGIISDWDRHGPLAAMTNSCVIYGAWAVRDPRDCSLCRWMLQEILCAFSPQVCTMRYVAVIERFNASV